MAEEPHARGKRIHDAAPASHLAMARFLDEVGQQDVLAAGEGVGWVYLIYCNGSEGGYMFCMSDMSANPICEAIDKKVQRILEEQEL